MTALWPIDVSAFHFLRPLWLLALLGVPLLWRALGERSRRARWSEAVDRHLLDALLTEPADRIDPWPRRLAVSVWVLSILALAGPTWRQLPEPVYRSDVARVVVLSLAESMNAGDSPPSRIARARFKTLDLLKKTREGQVGLIAYAGDAHVIAPLTPDANTVAALVPGLSPEIMPVRGEKLGEALALAVKLLSNAGSGAGEIILLSDSLGDGAVADLKKRLGAGRYTLSVIGVGSDGGAPIALPGGGFLKDKRGAIVLPKLDRAGLQALARAGGGEYADLSADDRDLELILKKPVSLDPATRQPSLRSARWYDSGPWLLLLALPLALLGFRRGWLGVVLPFALLSLPAPEAQAWQWRDLWQRPAQQAEQAFEAGRHAEAAQQFDDPLWQGAAWYRAGDYAKAAEAFAKSQEPQAHYNRGNALAKLGQLDGAIKAYEQALQQAPDLADAKANKALLEQLKNQQAAPPSSSEQSQAKPDNPPPQQNAEGEEAQNNQGQQAEPNNPSDSAAAPPHAQASQQAPKPDTGQASEQPASEPASEPDTPPKPAESAAEDNERAKQAAQARAGKPGEAMPEGQEHPPGQPAAVAGQAEAEQDEKARALEQWLNKIPDDPGGLLREKLRRESARRLPPETTD